MNDRVLADLAGDGDAPPRGDRGSNLRAALPLDIPRSASHDELWDRDTAGKAKDVEEPADATTPAEEAPLPDVVSEALATYTTPFAEPELPAPAAPAPEALAAPARPAASSVRPQELGEDGPGRLVRPYAMTGGRTRSVGAEIPLEALVIVTDEGRHPRAGSRLGTEGDRGAVRFAVVGGRGLGSPEGAARGGSSPRWRHGGRGLGRDERCKRERASPE